MTEKKASAAADALEGLSPPPADEPAPVPVAGEDNSPSQKATSGRGGARPGAGRPRKDDAAKKAAPVADDAAQAAAAAVAEKFFEAHRDEIVAALAELYGFPFELFADKTGIDELRLDPEKAKARAALIAWCVRIYAPQLAKHLPLVLLATSVAADVGGAIRIYRAHAKKAAPAKPALPPAEANVTAAAIPAPATPVPPAAPTPAPAPKRKGGTSTSSGASAGT